MAFVALYVVIGRGGQFQIEARVERRFGNLVLFLGSVDVSLCRFQEGVVLHHGLPCGEQVGRHATLDRGRGFQLIRQASDGTEEIGLGIGQVDLFGVEVVLRQGQTCFGLIQISRAAYALAATHADLVVDALMRLQIVARQRDHLAAHQHIEVYLDGAQGQAFRRAKQTIGA